MIKRVLVALAALALAGSAASAAGVNGATLSKDKRTTSVAVGSGHFSPTALPHKEAIRRLKLSSGTQFDPNVVSVFVELHSAGAIHVQ